MNDATVRKRFGPLIYIIWPDALRTQLSDSRNHILQNTQVHNRGSHRIANVVVQTVVRNTLKGVLLESNQICFQSGNLCVYTEEKVHRTTTYRMIDKKRYSSMFADGQAKGNVISHVSQAEMLPSQIF